MLHTCQNCNLNDLISATEDSIDCYDGNCLEVEILVCQSCNAAYSIVNDDFGNVKTTRIFDGN